MDGFAVRADDVARRARASALRLGAGGLGARRIR
jgi:hypothetical protein